MRGVLVLTGLLIGLAVAFLVAWPQLVEVPDLREQLAGILREASGTDLRLEGAVRLEVLPRPRITIERAVVGDRIEIGPGPRFSADRIDIDLAVLPLLAGRIEPRGVQLVRPVLGLAEIPGGWVEGLLRPLLAGPLAGVDRINVVDGSLDAGPPGPLSAIDAAATRDALGAFHVDLTLAASGEPVRVTMDGGPLALEVPIPLTVKAELGPQVRSAEVGFSGQVRLAAGGNSADGMLTVDARRGQIPAWFAPGPGLPWKLEARLSHAPERLKLSELVLSLPGGELRGEAALALGAAPDLALSLGGTTLEITPELAAACRQLLTTARGGDAGSGSIRVDIASLTWGGEQVRRLVLDGAWRPDVLDLRALDAVLPGQSALHWRGAGPTAREAPLNGQLTLQSADLHGLLSWLGVDPRTLPEGGLTSLDLEARAAIGATSIALTEMKARLDTSSVSGSVSLASEPRPRADLDLQVDRLNTALYGSWGDVWATWRPRLEALDGSLALAVGQLSHDQLRGRDLSIHADLEAGRLDLAELRLAGPAGTALDLRGTLDLPLGAWDGAGDLTVAEPAQILQLLGLDAPTGLDRLAPLQLSGSSRREAGVTSVDLRLGASGVSLTLQAGLEGEMADGKLAATLIADAANTGDILSALGWPQPAERLEFGPLAARLELSRADGPLDIRLDASAGGSRATGAATLATTAARPLLAGRLSLPRLDTELAAALYQTLAQPLGFPPGDPWLWPGIWPRRPLAWGWLDTLDAQLALDAGDLRRADTSLGSAQLEVDLASGDLDLRNVRMPLAGGTLTGNATLEGRKDHGVVSAEFRLDGARIERLAAATAVGSAIRGRLDMTASLVGEGRGIADIVGSVTGDGVLGLTEAVLPEVGDAGQALENTSLRGPFTVAGGILDAPSLELGEAGLDLRVDLLTWILQATLKRDGTQYRFFGPPGRITSVAVP